MLKRVLSIAAICLAMMPAVAQTGSGPAKVYFTSEITPDALLDMFRTLGVKPEGKVAVKISTGESEKSNHLRPELIGKLVKDVGQ